MHDLKKRTHKMFKLQQVTTSIYKSGVIKGKENKRGPPTKSILITIK